MDGTQSWHRHLYFVTVKKILHEMPLNPFWMAFALLQKGLRLSTRSTRSWLLYSIIIWIQIYETLLWKPVRNLWHLLLDEDWTKLRKVASQCWYWYWFDYCAAARSNLGLGSVAPAPGNDLVLARNAGTKCWRVENTWYNLQTRAAYEPSARGLK